MSAISNEVGAIERYVADYETRQTAMMKTLHPYNEQARNDRIKTWHENEALAAERLASALWGAFIQGPTENGITSRYQLDPAGAAWRELDRAEGKLREAKDKAAHEGILPDFLSLAVPRATSILMNSKTPAVATAEYNRGDTTLRICIQELSALAQRETRDLETSMAWSKFRHRIEADREARLNTSAVQAASAALDAIFADLETAYRLTKMRLCNWFARYPYFGPGGMFGSGVLDGIDRQYQPVDQPDGKRVMYLSYERKPFGGSFSESMAQLVQRENEATGRAL